MSFRRTDAAVRQTAVAGGAGGGSGLSSAGCGIAQSAPGADVNTLPAGVPLLFIDASSPLVQTGLWQSGHWLAHQCADAPALEEIFRSVSELLSKAKLSFTDIGGFIHNEGPGSILGIRLGAMALRVWAGQGGYAASQATGGTDAVATVATAPETVTADASVLTEAAAPLLAVTNTSALPVWAVRSLPLVAAKIAFGAGFRHSVCATAGPVATNVCEDGLPAAALAALAGGCVGGVFSEFRQGLWNWFTPDSTDVFGESIEVIETEELAERIASAQGRVWHLRHRKSWESPPGDSAEADGNLHACPQVLSLPGLLRRVALPEALLTRAPEFKTTSGERHRGAGAALQSQAPASGNTAQSSASQSAPLQTPPSASQL